MQYETLYNKILQKSKTNKFNGIPKDEFYKYFSNSSEAEEAVKKMQADKYIRYYKKRIFPYDFKFQFTEHEEKIINHISSCLDTGRTIFIGHIKKEFFFITSDSLNLLLSKMVYNQLIVRLDEVRYIRKDLFETIKVFHTNNESSIKIIKVKFNLPRETVFLIVKKIEE